MEVESIGGALSLLPVAIALVLAFWSKDAVFSLLMGCLVGVVIAGLDPATGIATLLKNALGNSDFMWVCLIVMAVGVLIAFYLRAGVIASFTQKVSGSIRSGRAATGLAWSLGLFVFFSDYFSPLFAGPIARPLTDKHRVSREMLAYVLDSGSSPVATLLPLSAWAVYVAGLLKGYGPIDSVEAGMNVFISAIPYNFYGWLAVLLAGAYAFGLLPHFGPMLRAQNRASKEGKLIRDGASPLTGDELNQIQPAEGRSANLLIYLAAPMVLVFSISVSSFLLTGTSKILEAFLVAIFYLAVALTAGGYFKNVRDGVEVATQGIKGVLPAIMILALAFSINAISKALGAQHYIIAITQGWMTSSLLPLVTFITAATTSFFTGSSWGTYAILTPFVIPLAFGFSQEVVDATVLLTVGSLVGGGLFGDHCSPVSDTTCLSSFGAGCDHMDHVSTQLPYALLSGAVACLLALLFGYLVN